MQMVWLLDKGLLHPSGIAATLWMRTLRHAHTL